MSEACAKCSAVASELARVRAELEEANRKLVALHVLDAWAKRHEVMSPAPFFHWFTSNVDGTALPCWRISHGVKAVGGHAGRFTSADAARVAAADLLLSEDPTLAEGCGGADYPKGNGT